MIIYDRANDKMVEVIPRTYTLQKKFHRIGEKKLIFRHSHIAITDYEMGDNPDFEKALSVWDERNWKYRRVAGHYIKELKEFRVPRSFDTAILSQYFPSYQPIVENDAYPSDKIHIKLKAPPRDDEQRVALSFLCAQGDYKKNYRYTTLMLSQTVGTGKTYASVAATCFLQARVIVIVPFEKLLSQWKEAYLDFTSLKEDDIAIIQGSDKCQKILDGKYEDTKVFIFSVDTVISYQERYGDLQTIEMLRATKAYVKIVDEVHRNMKAISIIDALSNFHMNYYASATPDRSQKKERWIFRTIYRNCPRFGDNFKTVEEKWTNIIVARYSFTPTPAQIKRMVDPRKKWLNPKSYERELIYSSKEQLSGFLIAFRNVLKWSKKQLVDGNKILMLCSTVDGTEFLQKLAEEFFPGETARYYGTMKPKDKKAALKKTVICATSQSLGTGADVKGIQHVYNIETYSNSINAGQLPGRARKIEGVSVFYIEFVNYGYLKTYRQFESHKPYLIKASKTGKLMILE
ncbi:MAG: DEAD/DEAH box helicase family protein [Ruminococcus flavefaciens]|nr:DEAD/DEAH box helicase family protein [Ruminococcus flavefaciens]